MAEEGLRIAETVHFPFSLIEACHGVSVVYLRQGDVSRAIPCWSGPWVCARTGTFRSFAQGGRGPGPGVCPGGAYRRGSGSGGARGRARGRQRQSEGAGACCRLPERGLSAGGPPGEAHTRAAQALDLARQYQQRGTQAWALWLLGESTDARRPQRGLSPPQATTARPSPCQRAGMRPLQAHCHRGLGTLYATIGQREQARIELSTAIDMYRAMEMTFWLLETEAALAQVEA